MPRSRTRLNTTTSTADPLTTVAGATGRCGAVAVTLTPEHLWLSLLPLPLPLPLSLSLSLRADRLLGSTPSASWASSRSGAPHTRSLVMDSTVSPKC
jgi:hypothetical protein